MIEITYEKVMAALALFTAACVAGGWVIKIVTGVRKPADDVKKKLENEDKRLKSLEDSFDYIVKSTNLLIKAVFTVLSELAVNNDTEGRIAEMQQDMQDFLIKR